MRKLQNQWPNVSLKKARGKKEQSKPKMRKKEVIRVRKVDNDFKHK